MAESVAEIMQGFACRTGLGSVERPSTRYLWTDAFAVCNGLGLFVDRADEEALRRALLLVEETHHVLGRHRPDDTRRGWISGLDEDDGELHPTIGGLRIGKDLPERAAGAPYDPELEWNRDGQYFHYLTRWIHALRCVYGVTKEVRYARWAAELAQTACASFRMPSVDGSAIGLYWKMSIDLSRPLVPSMGQHDALDGWITCARLQADSARTGLTAIDLAAEIRALSQMFAGRDLYTEDALGLGGLLVDAHALARMMLEGDLDEPHLLRQLLDDALAGLSRLARSRCFDHPAEMRLPFREFGLSIGLHAIARLRTIPAAELDVLARIEALPTLLSDLDRYRPLATQIEKFWSEPENRQASTWLSHREINEVMWATSLAPCGYLEL